MIALEVFCLGAKHYFILFTNIICEQNWSYQASKAKRATTLQ